MSRVIAVVMKGRRFSWVGLEERWGRGDMHVKFGGGNMRERDRWEDLSIDERIVLIIDVKVKCAGRTYE